MKKKKKNMKKHKNMKKNKNMNKKNFTAPLTVAFYLPSDWVSPSTMNDVMGLEVPPEVPSECSGFLYDPNFHVPIYDGCLCLDMITRLIRRLSQDISGWQQR